MDESERQLHVNFCANVAIPSQDSTLKCPVCGITLTKRGSIAHIKRCAAQHGIATATVLARLKGEQAHVRPQSPLRRGGKRRATAHVSDDTTPPSYSKSTVAKTQRILLLLEAHHLIPAMISVHQLRHPKWYPL